MAYLIVNSGKTEGTVRIKNSFKVFRPGERFVSDVAPTSWSRFIRVIKQADQPVHSAVSERASSRARAVKESDSSDVVGGTK